MSNVGQRTTVMFSEFKERWLVKLIVAALFSAVLFGMMGTVLADDVSSFDELKSILTASGSSEVTIDLKNGIALGEGINVNTSITKLTLYMNRNTIDGNGNPFLNFEGTCELAIKNTRNDYDPSHYLDSEGNLNIDPNTMGTIDNCSTDDNGAVINFNDNSDAKILFQDITFGNNASEYGTAGVVYVNGSGCTFTAKGCRFIGNKCNWFDGGALYFNESNTINISCCEFSRNYGEERGGAIFALADNNITISHCTFKENETGWQVGGAICVCDSTNLHVDNTVFNNNMASSQGGAIYQGDSDVPEKIRTGILTIDKCIFNANEATDFGGAVHTKDLKDIAISNSKFKANKSEDCGGVRVSGVKATFFNCDFSDNAATTYGGAILDDALDLSVDNCRFSRNIADEGGAIADPFYRYIIRFNSDGYVLDASDLIHEIEIKNSTFHENKAVNGGAFYETPGLYVDFDDGYGIEDGKYYYQDGSGPKVYFPLDTPVGNHTIIDNSVFSENEATKFGGAILCDNPLDTVIRGGSTRIEKNKADISGGGVFVVGSGTFSLDGAPFTDNTDETKNNAPVGKDIALKNNSVIQIKSNLGINIYDVAKYADGTHQPGLITAGLSNNGTVNNFKSSEGYTVLLNSNKNAVLGFKVTLNTNGGTINSGNVTGYIVGTETVLPTDVTKKGQMFLGWFDNSELAGEPITRISDSETGNRQYWAKWKEGQYSIVFRNDDGKVLKTYAVDAGMIPEYTGETPAKPADEKYTYAFSGWIPEITAASDDATYTATYTRTPRTYAVILNPNGGTINSGNVTSYVYGTETVLPTDVRRDWCIFVGWYDNSECNGSPITVISDTETGDKQFWAMWVEIFKLPDTGDKSNIWFWIGTVLLGMAGITILARGRK